MRGYPCGYPRICLCWIDVEFDSSNIYLLLEVVLLYLLPDRGRIFYSDFRIART